VVTRTKSRAGCGVNVRANGVLRMVIWAKSNLIIIVHIINIDWLLPFGPFSCWLTINH